MSPAPSSPGRSPPCVRTHGWFTSPAGAVILPPAPRASRSSVLAAARLRALHLDPLRAPSVQASYRGNGFTPRQQPPSS